MAESSDIYLDYYSTQSLSSKLSEQPSPRPTRRITLDSVTGDDRLPPGGPPRYDPAAMNHSQRTLYNQETLYVAPLAYYALQALKPWYFMIDTSDQPLSPQMLVSSIKGEERVNIGDILVPWASQDVSCMEPATWAFLIQHYHGLPEHYSRYQLALNDPHLTMLAVIPPTPRFSLITVLDLSACKEMEDGNISQLKVLTSLCVLDTSRTRLTDQGVKNLKSTLTLRDPGPIHLRSWNLRGCRGITYQVLYSLSAFPLLCILDLRDTSVVLRYRCAREYLQWRKTSLLPVRDHLECFWPEPQHRIPGLLAKLEATTFSHPMQHTTSDESPPTPFVIHVDRLRPASQITSQYPYWHASQSRVSRSTSSRIMSSTGYIPNDMLDDDLYPISPPASPGLPPLSPGFLMPGDHDISASEGSSTASDTEELETPFIPPPESILDSLGSSDFDSPSASQDSDVEDGDQLDDIIAQELAVPASIQVPHFYNARAQAGIAPPRKRKRFSSESSGSSKSEDLDAVRKVEYDHLSERERDLMLLRQPPPWSTTEKLVVALSRKLAPLEYKPASSTLDSAKKRKVEQSGTMALWAQIKASNKTPGRASGQPGPSTASTSSNAARQNLGRQCNPTPTQRPAATQQSNPPARRTTLGRAPRPPGTIVRKLA